MIGKVILNYKIISKIGEGGMGVVYKAIDLNLDRVVAIKVLHSQFLKNKELMERFKIEAKVQAKLIHPNICTLFSMFEHKGNLFMVMEYVEGISLSEILEKKGKIPLKKALNIFIQVLKGISTAHRSGIIHRDIKPSNILISKDGTAKVMDFGIAKIKGASKLTKTGTHLGTIYYMSPEQVKGNEIDFRSDIYSLGATIFEVITGRPPFLGNTEFEILEAHIKSQPPLPSKINPDLPKIVDKIILKSLEKNPNNRYKSADEFRRALESLLNAIKNDTNLNEHNIPILESKTIVEKTANKATELLSGNKKILIASFISLLFITTLILAIILIKGRKKAPPKGKSSTTLVKKVNVQNPIKKISNFTTQKNKPQQQISQKAVASIAKEIATGIFKRSKNKTNTTNKPKNKVFSKSTPKTETKTSKNKIPKNPLAKENSSTEIQEENNSILDNKLQFAQLLSKINSCYENGKIFSPPKDNAIYYYQKAKEMNPNAPELQDLKEIILEEVKVALDSAITNQNYREAKHIFSLYKKTFPEDEALSEYQDKMEQLSEIEKAVRNSRVFYVIHDHSGDFTQYDSGIIFIKNGDTLVYMPIFTNDGRKDGFEVHLYSIKEVKTNFWDIGGFKCFHIKLKNGKNYNFILVDKYGNSLDPSIFVDYYKSLK